MCLCLVRLIFVLYIHTHKDNTDHNVCFTVEISGLISEHSNHVMQRARDNNINQHQYCKGCERLDSSIPLIPQ